MAETTETIRHYGELPEGAMAIGVVEVVDILTADGEPAYVIRVQGGESPVSVIGTLELAKKYIIDNSNFPDDEGD